MKNYQFLYILCFCIVALTYGCEKAELQKSAPNDTVQVDTRGDCEECPGFNECCCFVELEDEDNAASVVFCGTSDGPDNCSPAPSCVFVSFSGLGETFILNDTDNPRELFCMDENGGFWNYNSHATDVANIIITCQGELTNPDTIHLHIQPLTRVHYKTNGSCELGPC